MVENDENLENECIRRLFTSSILNPQFRPGIVSIGRNNSTEKTDNPFDTDNNSGKISKNYTICPFSTHTKPSPTADTILYKCLRDSLESDIENTIVPKNSCKFSIPFKVCSVKSLYFQGKKLGKFSGRLFEANMVRFQSQFLETGVRTRVVREGEFVGEAPAPALAPAAEPEREPNF